MVCGRSKLVAAKIWRNIGWRVSAIEVRSGIGNVESLGVVDANCGLSVAVALRSALEIGIVPRKQTHKHQLYTSTSEGRLYIAFG